MVIFPAMAQERSPKTLAGKQIMITLRVQVTGVSGPERMAVQGVSWHKGWHKENT
jgi:hypothetical protein